ncbi:MAG: aminopeptidase P family N-terminal domain-containing protein, partial [Campylobacterota bacterium]
MQNYIVKNENAIYYECGYSCDNAIFLSLGSDGYFITDGRYTQEASDSLGAQFEVVQSSNLIKTTREILRKHRVKSLVYDPKQWELQSFDALQKYSINYRAKVDFSWKKRAVKTQKEIALLKKAVELGDRAFDRFAQ